MYTSEFDTINLGENDVRAIIALYITKGKIPTKSYKELKKVVTDTFVRINDSVIFVNDIRFEEKGHYYLDGYIIDEILLDRNEEDDAILTTIQTKVIHPIAVVPKK